MADEPVEKIEDEEIASPPEPTHVEEAEQEKAHEDKLRKLSVREALNLANNELKDKAEAANKPKADPESKPVDKEPAPAAESKTEGQEPPQGEPPVAEKPTAITAPESWPKDVRTHWDKLPAEVQQTIAKREEDSKRGVDELRSRYAEVDDAYAPYDATIRAAGRTRGQVTRALLDWNMALAGPRKNEAILALAQNFGINLAALTQNAGLQGQQSQVGAVPDELRPVLEPLHQKIGTLEAQLVAQQQQEQQRLGQIAQQRLGEFAKDRPYFERVRQDMKTIVDMDMAAAQRGLPSQYMTQAGELDLAKAYETACRMRTDVWAEIQEAERVKRETEEKNRKQTEAARAALEAKRAREAAGSVKSGSPGEASTGNGAAPPKGEKAGDSIRRAVAELRGRGTRA